MKIGIVCSHGGHLTETLSLWDAFSDHEVFFATFHSPRTKAVAALAKAYLMENYSSNIIRHMVGIFWALKIIIIEKPDVIVSLGADIAIPFFLWAKLFRIKTLFIESWCRVETLSLTGKILYPLADVFWVQWPQLLKICGPKAEYKGAVI